MKKAFRKLRGKKDSEGESNRGPNDAQRYSGYAQNPEVNQNSSSAIRDAAFRLVNERFDKQEEPVKLPKPSNVAPRQLSAISSSPTLRGPDDIIEIQQPPLCPVCCNLDPYRAPPDGNEGRESWAAIEFKIPVGVRVAKVSIDKSETLIEASRRGCLYCYMVHTALGAIHPGWETEKSFIHLYLAPGLPVVVRLEFGGTSSVILGREAMLELGVDLPEGQQMNFTITIGDPSKPAVEIEIYRARVAPGEETVGDKALTPLVKHMGVAEEIPAHAGEQKCFNFIQENLTKCMKEHKCGRDGHLPLLPDRVIWIGRYNNSPVQLLEPKDIRAKYIALSYCWGSVGPNTFLTDKSTLEARKAGIQYNDLPPLFQDVIASARVLGIEYIWIDRLCIIQGDGEDFSIQAPKMGEIYGNATLTIAAATATSEQDHILVERGTNFLTYNLNMDVNGIGSLKLRFRRRTHPLGKEDTGGDYGKVSTRAWIWQERLLSGRTVFYTPSALKFECHCHSIWEGFGQDVTGHSWSSKLEDITHVSWTTLVEEYMGRDITRPSDRLPAMESVMKRIQKHQGWSPLWGMWANALVESLGWQTKETGGVGMHEARMNPAFYAPTWSWASVDGPISYVSAKGMGGLQDNDPMKYDLEVRSLNAASGLITFVGHVISVELSCRAELNVVDEGNPNPTEENKYKYYYEILKVSTTGEVFPIKADVALKPWTGNINGRQTSTVIRVPYGEKPPIKSWTARCLCLLVGKMKLRALVLFLGASVRVPGAWERLGMVDGIHPGVFQTSQRQVVNMV